LASKRIGVEVHRNDALFSAVGPRDGNAGNGHQPRAQEIHGGIEHRLFGHAGAGQAQLHDRNAGRGVLEHQRRLNARRQLPQLRLLDGHHLRHGRGYIGVRLEENLDDREAGQRLRFDVLDVVDRGGEAAFIDRGDAIADFLGRETRVGPDNADDRNVDFRKDVRGHLEQNQRCCEENQQRHHQESVWAPQRNLNNPHYLGNPFLRPATHSLTRWRTGQAHILIALGMKRQRESGNGGRARPVS
jgi:hypothetical protein